MLGYNGEVKNLFKSLTMEFRIEDPSFTSTVHDRDKCVKEIQAMAAGMAMGLPRTYEEAVNGVNGDEWKEACWRR